MISLIKVFIIISLANLIKNINPMKARVTILFMRTLIFSLIFATKGSCWVPIIFYLLFMGGILMMFMILSSLAPNEQSKKMKVSLLRLALIFTIISIEQEMTRESTQLIIKQRVIRAPVIILRTFIIIIYFFSFLAILSEQKICMRSTICH